MFILISPKFDFITSLIYLLDIHLAYLLVSKAKFCGYLDSGTKQATHRLKIIFGLLGFKAADLHGNLTLAQRLDALEVFRKQEVNFLIATDVAARGLDIIGVQTVINFACRRDFTRNKHKLNMILINGKRITKPREGKRREEYMVLDLKQNATMDRIVMALLDQMLHHPYLEAFCFELYCWCYG